ncbi:MAG: mechanosensitive ion channel family protein [Bacilli bacterium]|nr:mechanosensitive ion channel family protein [Bacilli bacterium]
MVILLINHDAMMKYFDGVSVTNPDTKEVTWTLLPAYMGVDESNVFLVWWLRYGLKGIALTVEIVGAAITLAVLLHFVSLIPFQSKKAKTISRLLENFIKWVVFIASIFLVMAAWGADSIALLTSAGVLTLIIGLGSQSLVADILAGIFIVFEGDFQVGDIIIVDGWRGEVTEIGIRTTKLIDAGGNIKIINNSDIRSVVNQTQELSIAKCYMSVDYGTRIEKVESVIADNLAKVKAAIPDIVEGPFYKGVAELADSSINLLFIAKCKEGDIYQVQRDLNRELLIVFNDNGIDIPFNQIVVDYRQENKEQKVSKKDVKKAEALNAEQKELSAGIEVKPVND